MKEIEDNNRGLEYITEKGKEYPTLGEEFWDLYQWYVSEVESGESEENEYSLLIGDVDALIENFNETI